MGKKELILQCGSNEAYIVVISKAHKEIPICANYKPISLMQIDVKLLSVIFAKRFKKILIRPDNSDQAGFIYHEGLNI